MRDIESLVFTRICNDLPEELIEKYDMTFANFSTESKVQKEAIFPCVYVHLLPGAEKMNDLRGVSFNGGLYTIQVDVTDNEKASTSKEIIDAITMIMKAMRFTITDMPEFSNADSSLYRQTARYKRLIGSGDSL